MVQLLRLHAPNAGGLGSIPGQGTKSPYTIRCRLQGEGVGGLYGSVAGKLTLPYVKVTNGNLLCDLGELKDKGMG